MSLFFSKEIKATLPEKVKSKKNKIKIILLNAFTILHLFQSKPLWLVSLETQKNQNEVISCISKDVCINIFAWISNLFAIFTRCLMSIIILIQKEETYRAKTEFYSIFEFKKDLHLKRRVYEILSYNIMYYAFKSRIKKTFHIKVNVKTLKWLYIFTKIIKVDFLFVKLPR